MKTKLLGALVLAVIVLGTLAAGAAAAPIRTAIVADLQPRPGVAHHQGVGGLDASYNRNTGRLTYSIKYKNLVGRAFRIVIRSRATGANYVVICDPCNPVYSKARTVTDGSATLFYPAYWHVDGTQRVDPDIAYLMEASRTFVEVDTTAYPSGEIGGITGVPRAMQGPGETPRCC
jgi:CHRD domain-containing protein